jgi:uroporphyrinogen decarboxylase
MHLTKKERMRLAMLQQPVDNLPTQINYTAALGEVMADHFGISPTSLPNFLGNHMIRVDIDSQALFSNDGRIKFDWWGVGFDVKEEGYFTTFNPLKEHKDLDRYSWPNPDDPELLSKARYVVEADAGVHFVAPHIGFALFERAWTLRGFDTFLMDLALDPGYASALLDRIVEIQLVLIKRFIELGVDGGYFGDDYGAQKNMLFSPKMWRALIKPRLARLFAPFREADLPIIMHSDGQIQTILPDLVEIGLTTLNPIQPEVLNHQWLRNTFGDSLGYYGGISTQTVLPKGTPAEVKQSVRDCIAQLAPHSTGLVLAPSHRLMTDIPIKNIETLIEAFQEIDF